MTRTRKILRSLLVVGLAAAVVGGATFSAFSGATSSSGNSFAAGTVAIGDNDAGAAVVSLAAAAPGSTSSGCIAVTATGSLDSAVRLYGTISGALGPYVTLTVTRGTQASPSFRSCTGFTPDATNYAGLGSGVLYSGPLSSYPATYAAGIVDPVTATPETWTTGETHVYRFDATLANNNAAQGTSATATFTWEAQNL